MLHPRLLPALAFVAAGCTSTAPARAPTPQPEPLPAAEPPDPPVVQEPPEQVEPPTDPHRVISLDLWREDCDAIGEKLPCKLVGDLDGDGKTDRVVIVEERSTGISGFAVKWGAGGHSVIGANRRVLMRGVPDPDEPELEPHDEIYDSLDWLVDWRIAPRKDGKVMVRIARRRMPFALPGLLGDALYVSGGDAAALFYVDNQGWRWYHLGF